MTYLTAAVFAAKMGPRRTSSQKPHRFIGKAKKNATKPKRNKSLKNKVRDVQRLLKKVRVAKVFFDQRTVKEPSSPK